MKKWKQLIAVLMLAVVCVSGCAGKAEPQYNFSIYEDEKRFSEEDVLEQEKFEAFLKDVFVEEMTKEPLSAHLRMEHPESYGIEELEMNWGEMPGSQQPEEAVAELEKVGKRLTDFDYDSLSSEQQILYDIFERYLENERKGQKYEMFESVFSPMSGIQTSLPIIFSEYAIQSQKDIEDYLVLLNTSYDCVKQFCDYEMTRKEAGYTLTEYSINEVTGQCREFIDGQPNCLRPVFEEKLNTFSDLTAEEREGYLKQFDREICDKLIPAYQLIIDTLSQIKGQGESGEGLSSYENGKEYYEYLVRNNTGSSRTIEELYHLIEEELNRTMQGVTLAYDVNSKLFEDMERYEYSTKDPQEIMKILEKELEKDFPAAVNKDYEINYVPQSMESMMAPAFYLVPPIDNLKKNVIYINQSEAYAHMELFPTMAHEGFPGHMYQTNYFYSQNPHYFRSLLNFKGYVEGWAQYVETCYAYEYSGMNRNLSGAFSNMTSCNMALYSMVDIGVNYYGWGRKEAEEFLKKYIEADEKMVSEIYYTIIDEPTSYLSYYAGYLEIKELKDKAAKTLKKDFDLREFHEFLLEIGPCQFDIIEERMEKWMDGVQGKHGK